MGLENYILNGPKDRGIYLSSHPLYQYLWKSDKYPIFICNVNKYLVKKFRSEIIMSSFAYNNDVMYEYVANTKDVIPLYILYYKVYGDIRELYQNNTIWVKGGEFGCKKCDRLKLVCHCKLQ